MKKQILGFMAMSQFVNNTPGQNSQLGELSTLSMTYTFDRGEYSDPTVQGHRLVTFSVQNTADGSDTSLTAEEASLAIRISKACVDYGNTTPVPVNPQDFLQFIQAEFYSEIQELEFGELLNASATTLPTWFGFTSKNADKNVYRIWMADRAFQIQYPEYDIKVIPPLSDVRTFLGNWQAAANSVDAYGNAQLILDTQAAKQDHPETYIRYFEFDFVNRLNPTQRKKTSWYILVYGEAGDNEDIAKDAIIDLLLKQSGQPESVWQELFPELFKRTEFVCYPRYDLISIPNLSVQTGLYSSMIPLENSVEYAQKFTTSYPADFVRKNTIVFPVTYKALSVLAVNGQNNMEESKVLRDIWYDYIPVPTTSPDFQRMRPITQNWVDFFLRLTEQAESSTTVSALPQGMRRVRRNDVWFISATFNRATYLVAARYNNLTPPTDGEQ